MAYPEDEIKEKLFGAIKMAQESLGSDWLEQNLSPLVKGFRSADYLYKPDEALTQRIEDYKTWCQTQEGEDPGQLMEEIAFLAFRCLRGWTDIKSYQSYAAQYDLVISGTDIDWMSFIAFMRSNWKCRTIVVEAKNISEKINDQIFSRLCGILQNVFEHSSDLGVFFTRLGATGFPDDSSDIEASRQRVLRDAQTTQIIFHAKTGKCVIVLTHNDILKLVEPGALPILLEAKIRAIEEYTGLPVRFEEDWKEIDLPVHLKRFM
jgi:predicted nuclease of predicted toxin-antitoxin system